MLLAGIVEIDRLPVSLVVWSRDWMLVAGVAGVVGAAGWLLWNRRRADHPIGAAGADSRRAAALLLLAGILVTGWGLLRWAPRPDGDPPDDSLAEVFLEATARRGEPAGLPAPVRPGEPLSETPLEPLAESASGGLAFHPPRPFLHSQHESVACTDCHGSGEEHRTFRVQTAADCAACHHDPRRTAYACADCHGPEVMPAPGRVVATLHPSVWEEPRSRELPFDHADHADRECAECHTGGVLLTPETECRSCHEEHHAPETNCTRCHLPTEPEAHGIQAHLTCAGSGCHAAERGERPALTRNLCLVCHEEQRDHEPGGDCARCHMIPPEPTRSRGVVGWLSRRLGGGS